MSIATATPVTGLVIEAIQKTVSVAIGCCVARSATPCGSRCTMPSGLTTTVTAPAISPAAIRPASHGMLDRRMPADRMPARSPQAAWTFASGPGRPSWRPGGGEARSGRGRCDRKASRVTETIRLELRPV